MELHEPASSESSGSRRAACISRFGIAYHYAAASGLELILSQKSPRHYPRHIHVGHWIVGKVQAGSATLATVRETRSFSSGQCFIVPPRLVHSLSVAPESKLAVLCLDKDMVCSSLPVSADASSPILPRGILQEELAEFTDLGGLLRKARAAQVCDDSMPELFVQSVFDALLVNPEEPFPLQRMAVMAGCSRWHFLRLFQQRTGMTPHALQVVCRLRAARALLRNGKTPAEAAVTAGFADQSHMHKVFKLHHGLTPGQFRLVSARLERFAFETLHNGPT